MYLHLKAEHSDGILAQLLFLMSVVRNGNQADFQLLVVTEQLSRKTPVLGLSLSESSCNRAWVSLN